MTTSYDMNQDFTADFTGSLVDLVEAKVAKAKAFRPATFDVLGYLEYLFDYAGDKAATAVKQGKMDVAQYNLELQEVLQCFLIFTALGDN